MALGQSLLSVLFLQLAFASAVAPAWDVAIGRRPYIAETEGHLLLKTPGAVDQAVHISASLAGISRTWTWNVTGGDDIILSLGSLSDMPQIVNNDMIINVSFGGKTFTQRRRFMRAFKENTTNTVQVDHHTAGLLVDGQPWAGFGWYIVNWKAFAPRSCSSLSKSMPDYLAKLRECTVWGVGNETREMERMAVRGVNMIMPYGISPYDKHGLPGGVPDSPEFTLQYFDAAAKHNLKVLFPIPFLDRGYFNNQTLAVIKSAVNLVKNHPALLAYYICDDCTPNPDTSQWYNTIKELDPFHLTVGATFGNDALPMYGDSVLTPPCPGKHCADSNDSIPVLPGVRPTGKLVPCDKNIPCPEVRAPNPHTPLSLDILMVENYNPWTDGHAQTDAGHLRYGVPWEPVVNCDASYALEENMKPHLPPKMLLTNMWMGTVMGNTASQLVFDGGTPFAMEGMAIGKAGDQWGSKGSWMLYSQVEIYAAQARVILPSLYAPFGLPQPNVTMQKVTQLLPQPPAHTMPVGKFLEARAWRQDTGNSSKWCGHLVVVSGIEQSPVMFTLQLGGSFPRTGGNHTALRLFDAGYIVQIGPDGSMTDYIDGSGSNIYEIGDCVTLPPPVETQPDVLLI